MRLAAIISLAATLASTVATTARADEDAPVDVTLEPWASFDGADRPFRYIATVRNASAAPLEVALDRRLLSFEVRPTEGRRRRYRCRHPDAPRRTPTDRVHTLEPGEEHREWIDLRMYCWGRALDALEGGAEVEGRYGWRRRTRRRWVAGAPEASWRDRTGGVELMPFTFLGVPEDATETHRIGGPEDGGPSPVELDLGGRSVRRGSALTFRPAVRAREGSERVYVRPDSWAFNVTTPDGDRVRCAIPGGGGSPPPDLFRRITERVAARELLDADAFCPEDTFERAGIYEVVPKLRLRHSGAEYELDAVTGRFSGPPTAIRITHGSEGYVEQIPAPAEAAGDLPRGDDGHQEPPRSAAR